MFRIAAGESPFRVSEVPLDGGEPRTLVPEDRNVAWFALDVSPDGESLAYLTWDAAANRWQPEVASLSDPGAARTFDMPSVLEGPDLGLVRWSPDGASIHFVREDDRVGNVWSLPMDGGPPRPVTAFPADRMAHFAWSFDGSQLAIMRGERSQDVVLLENFR